MKSNQIKSNQIKSNQIKSYRTIRDVLHPQGKFELTYTKSRLKCGLTINRPNLILLKHEIICLFFITRLQ